MAKIERAKQKIEDQALEFVWKEIAKISRRRKWLCKFFMTTSIYAHLEGGPEVPHSDKDRKAIHEIENWFLENFNRNGFQGICHDGTWI